MNLAIKGAVGKFQYALNKDGKCDWYVIDRETGDVIDRAENMSTAASKAKHHYEMSKFTYEQQREMGWAL